MRTRDPLTELLPKTSEKGWPRTPSFLAVDFYCGAGGTTRGLIDAGGYVIAGLDKQESCRRTYVSNNRNESGDRDNPLFINFNLFPATDEHPNGQQQDALALLEELIGKHRLRFPQVPLLFSICAPCQPFTRLSKAEMSEDRVQSRLRDRGLLAHTCSFVKHFSPDIILSENVAGISDPRFGGIWEDFASRLRALKYSVSSRQVCASDFGIPQFRRRSIMGALKPSSENSFQSFVLPREDTAEPLRTVRDVLDDLPPIEAGEKHETIHNHIARGLSPLNKRRISFAPPGASNKYMLNTPDGDLSLACHKRVNDRLQNRCFTDVYTRMDPDRPSPTITTRCHSITNGRFGHYDGAQLRGISAREAARLQSFRDEYVFYPLHQVEPVARMIGNAVPPALAAFFAKHLVHAYEAAGTQRPSRQES